MMTLLIIAALVAFQSPSNRVKCSDQRVTRRRNQLVEGFNPLVIGSSVLMYRSRRGMTRGILTFQSPSNRVKCSDAITTYVVSAAKDEFQSPSNRVKCSDTRKSMSLQRR